MLPIQIVLGSAELEALSSKGVHSSKGHSKDPTELQVRLPIRHFGFLVPRHQQVRKEVATMLEEIPAFTQGQKGMSVQHR